MILTLKTSLEECQDQHPSQWSVLLSASERLGRKQMTRHSEFDREQGDGTKPGDLPDGDA